MLADLLTQTVEVSRTQAGPGITSSYQDTGNSYSTLIQPLGQKATLEWGMAMGKGYRAYFTMDADLQVSDKLVDGSGLEYRVVGLAVRSYGSEPHLTAYLELEPGK